MGKGRKNGTKKYNENGATGSTTKNEKGNVNIVGRDMNVGRDLIQTVHNYPPAQPLPAPPPSTPEELKKIIESLQSSLRRIYSKSYRSVIPVFSAPFFFDIEEKWVNLTLKLESDSIVTDDYATLLKKAFAKADMLIIEGNPGVGKSSLMQRLAYEWTQEESRLRDYDLVLYAEFRKLREYKFEYIKVLITHYMRGYLDEDDYEIFDDFICNIKYYKDNKILVLLDGYDESALDKQCQELSDYFYNTDIRPLRFNVLITSRKGYLSNLRNQGRFKFADIIGFTTESQRQEYILKHFNAANDIESSENTTAVTYLLETNANLKTLSESPLMLTFICLLHKNIIDGTEVELYMNIIWWMIDRYQKSNRLHDVPSLFDFEHDACDNFKVIENNYQHFPQLHLLGTMAMQDIFKTTFTETDLTKFQLKEIIKEVGFLRKEETRDTSFHTKVEYSFLHRTIQEFIMAFTFFFSNEEPTEHFNWYVFYSGRHIGYGIIQAKILKFLNMIYLHKININKSRKVKYSQLIQPTKPLMLAKSQKFKQYSTVTMHSLQDLSYLSRKNNKKMPQSQEEALNLVQDEATQGDAFAQYVLGLMYVQGILITQSNDEAVKWYTKSAVQGEALGQNNLGVMYMHGLGVSQSDEEAVKWFRKAAEQGNANGQFNMGIECEEGRAVPQSNKEAAKWYRKSAEQGYADAQCSLGKMYKNGHGVSQSDEEAVKWFRKSVEQGNANGQYCLGNMYRDGRGVPQSDEEAIKWFEKSVEQGNALALCNLGNMYESGKGVPQSDEEAVIWYTKSAEQGDAAGQNNLGNMFKYGKGVPQSDEEAVKWYANSAEQGNPLAQCNLGVMYENGRGLPQSDEEAVKCYTKSAEQGYANGQFCLGNMYRDGRGVPQSDEEAVKWFKNSADQKNGLALCNLGLMYDNGKGVPQSDEEAVIWYTKSAEQGDAIGQNNLGNMYRYGRGVPQSDEEAVKWYEKSAEQKNANGQFFLGFMYEKGKGTPQSNEEAIKWYTKSAEQGHAHAQSNLREISKKEQGILPFFKPLIN